MGFTLALSAPLVVSKTSFATLRPRWMQAPPTTVRSASHQLKPFVQAATAIPSSTGTNVAVRNGSRVARRKSHPNESFGLTSRPVSAETCSR